MPARTQFNILTEAAGARDVACRSFYTHPPPTYTPHYPLQLPLTPPGSAQPIPYPEIPLEIPLAPGLVPMRGEVAAPPAIGPPER